LSKNGDSSKYGDLSKGRDSAATATDDVVWMAQDVEGVDVAIPELEDPFKGLFDDDAVADSVEDEFNDLPDLQSGSDSDDDNLMTSQTYIWIGF
jgi:hypothetical protein